MAVDAQQLTRESDWRLHLGWGVGTIGASIFLNSFAALQAYYLTRVLGIAAATVGTLLLIAKLWDWVANPVMGMLSDRTDTRWGRRRPYLILGGIVTGLALAFFFNLARLDGSGSLVLITLALMLAGTGYTIFNVPYMAMPSEMVDDYKTRTKMMSYRVFFIGIGTTIGFGSQYVAERLGQNAAGYGNMGILMGLAIFFFMSLAFFGTTNGRAVLRSESQLPFWQRLRIGFENKPFAALLGTKGTQLFGLFTATAFMPFLIENVLGKEQPGLWLLYFTLCATAAQIVSIPFWLRVTRRLEKQKTYVLATLMFCAGSLTWLFASPNEAFVIFAARAVFKGFAAGGLLLMGQSMLPDTIEFDVRRSGLHREGVFSGLYSIVEKVAATFAPAILLYGYAWFGFDSKARFQTTEAIDGIRYTAAILPCIYFGLSLIPLYFYRLTEKGLHATKPVVS